MASCAMQTTNTSARDSRGPNEGIQQQQIELNNGDRTDEEQHAPYSSEEETCYVSSHSSKRLACPFHKHDPETYNLNTFMKYRACQGPGWITFKDVKNHIYRRHANPIYCERCFKTFRDESLKSEHIRLTPGCEVKSRPATIGVTAHQRERIKRECRTFSSEGEKWQMLYHILFPDDRIPYPYYDIVSEDPMLVAGSSSAFESFIQLQMNAVVSESLNDTLTHVDLNQAVFGARPQGRSLDDATDVLRQRLEGHLKHHLKEAYNKWEDSRRLSILNQPQPSPGGNSSARKSNKKKRRLTEIGERESRAKSSKTNASSRKRALSERDHLRLHSSNKV